MKKTDLISGREGCRTLLMIMACLIALSYFQKTSAADAAPVRIAVLPFEINAGQDLEFMRNGIQDMLGSRLSFKDEVIVIDKETVNRAATGVKGFTGESYALLVGGKLKADFIINGSITLIGNSTSIDSKLIDVSGKNPPITFFRQSPDPGGVIPAINQFATTINETIFKRSSAVAAVIEPEGNRQAAQPATGIAAAPSAQQQPSGANLNPYFAQNSQQTGGVESPNPEFTVTNNVRGSSGIWKSQTFKNLMNGIALGDVDRDNRKETVVLLDHSLEIFRFADGRFAKVAEPVKSKISTYIAVGVGDINGNGAEEIFVTSLNPDKNMPNSFVLEYDGTKYSKIVKSTPWYFRVTETKGEGKILLGQRQKSEKDDIYDSGIYRMRWDGEQYVPGEKLLDERKGNVLGALYDNITDDTAPSLASYDKADHIVIYGGGGSRLWRDLNESGGNLTYFHLPKETATDDQSLRYYPNSLRSTDINGDGHIEVLYAANHDVVGGYLSRFRKYSKGTINCAFWSGSGLSLQWSTPEQPGRISDFVVGDFDNDGANELAIANVTKDSMTTFSDSESIITVYELMQ